MTTIPSHSYLQPLLLILAAATMTVGNLGALKQQRLRRFMAYSSIAQAGFMGKFLLFAAAAQKGYYAMVVFAALNSTIPLYYYLLLVKEAYITQPLKDRKPFTFDPIQKTSLALLSSVMIFAGILPVFSSNIPAVVQ